MKKFEKLVKALKSREAVEMYKTWAKSIPTAMIVMCVIILLFF